MNGRDLASLIHLAGFATGVILYAMLGAMTQRRVANVINDRAPTTADRLPLIAAFLGVVWNLGAMVVFAVRDFGNGVSLDWLAAISYSSLGFLPAVVVHSALARGERGVSRWLIGLSYGTSAIVAVFHCVAAANGQPLSRSALLLLTIVYAGVLAVLAITERRQPGFQRTITAVALAAFAISALHLSGHAEMADQDSWWVELIGHHASLPLVLAVLYQEHRFAFSDLFLKRALAVLILVALISIAYASLTPLIDPHAIAARRLQGDGSHIFATAALLSLWLGTALAYPFIQRRASRFVDRVILRRDDYRVLRTELGQRLSLAPTAPDALDVTCSVLARAFGGTAAPSLTPESPRGVAHPTISLNDARTVACITIPTALAPAYEIRIAELPRGRDLLSDDLMLIDAVAAAIGRRLDEMWLEDERVARERSDQELRRLAAESELRALRAQLNPHFLFNALNTLGHLVQTAPDRAMSTLYRLTGLLRAVLRKTDGQFVTLGEEIEIIASYLDIERERFGERLNVEIDVPRELQSVRLPPLLLQPLVENAVKHGISPLRAGGTVAIRVTHDEDADGNETLRLVVSDSGAGMTQPSRQGVGLSNIELRLQHYFKGDAHLAIDSEPGRGTAIIITVPWALLETPAVAAAG
ncbi:MAG TPA: histidine kinase [Gemmatimonadaceae bacterium]|jgi:two-component system LytT family sensor kinase